MKVGRSRNEISLRIERAAACSIADENDRDQATGTRIATATKLAIDRRCGRNCIGSARVAESLEGVKYSVLIHLFGPEQPSRPSSRLFGLDLDVIWNLTGEMRI
jgi:hypothetical protein